MKGSRKMRGKIELTNPIKINGKKVKELTYDTNEITAFGFAEAEAKKLRAAGSRGGNLSGAVELDYNLHLYLGFAAIQAINYEYDIADLERMKGTDLVEVMHIGRNFIMKLEAVSTEEDSEEQSETTPENTILQ